MPDLIAVANGTLTMRVAASDTASGVEDSIGAVIGSPFREFTASIAVTEATAAGPGGGSITVTETSGRAHQIFFGPSPGALTAGALICTQDRCTSYEDFAPPTEVVTLSTNQAVPVRVVEAAESLDFYVADRMVGSVSPDGEPSLSGLRIGLYGAEGEEWTATVDAVRVTVESCPPPTRSPQITSRCPRAAGQAPTSIGSS